MSTLDQLLEARRAEYRALAGKNRWPHRNGNLAKIRKRLNGRQGRTYRRMFWLHAE